MECKFLAVTEEQIQIDSIRKALIFKLQNQKCNNSFLKIQICKSVMMIPSNSF